MNASNRLSRSSINPPFTSHSTAQVSYCMGVLHNLFKRSIWVCYGVEELSINDMSIVLEVLQNRFPLEVMYIALMLQRVVSVL